MATGEIIGKVNIPTKTALYEGIETDTASVLVDNVNKTIAVNVNTNLVSKDCAKSIESTQTENEVELSLKNNSNEVISSTSFTVESSPIIDSKDLTTYNDSSIKKLYRDIEADSDVNDGIFYLNKHYTTEERRTGLSENIVNYSTSNAFRNTADVFDLFDGDRDLIIASVDSLISGTQYQVYPNFVQEEVISDTSLKFGSSKQMGRIEFTLQSNVNKVILGIKKWATDPTSAILVNDEEVQLEDSLDIQEIEVVIPSSKKLSIQNYAGGKRFTLHYIRQSLQAEPIYTKQYIGKGGSNTSLEMPTIAMSGISSSQYYENKPVIYNPEYYPNLSQNNFYITIKIANADALKPGDEVQLCRYVKKRVRNKVTDEIKRYRYQYRRIYGVALTDKDIENIKKTHVYTLKLDYDRFVKFYKTYDAVIRDAEHISSSLSLARNNLYMRVLRRIDDNTGRIDEAGFKSSGKSLSVFCKLPLLIIDGFRDDTEFPEANKFTQFIIRTHNILDAVTITNNLKSNIN